MSYVGDNKWSHNRQMKKEKSCIMIVIQFWHEIQPLNHVLPPSRKKHNSSFKPGHNGRREYKLCLYNFLFACIIFCSQIRSKKIYVYIIFWWLFTWILSAWIIYSCKIMCMIIWFTQVMWTSFCIHNSFSQPMCIFFLFLQVM